MDTTDTDMDTGDAGGVSTAGQWVFTSGYSHGKRWAKPRRSARPLPWNFPPPSK